MRKLGVWQIEVCQGGPLQLQGLQGSMSGDEGERQPYFSPNLLLASQSFGIAGSVK